MRKVARVQSVCACLIPKTLLATVRREVCMGGGTGSVAAPAPHLERLVAFVSLGCGACSGVCEGEVEKGFGGALVFAFLNVFVAVERERMV